MKNPNRLRWLAAAMLALAALTVGAENRPVVIGNSRFTFITDNLVRMEYAWDQKFLDDSTYFAVVRRAADVAVSVAREGRTYVLTTPAMRIEYDDDGLPFGQNNLRVSFEMDGRRRTWCMTDEQSGNLKGAVTTVDAVGAPIPRQDGLLSRDGWFFINDTGTDVYRNGWLAPRDRDHVQDLYLFAYGRDYKAALRSLKAVSGPVPMTRRYVHGAWYCRWWPYTADDYRDLVRGYHEHGFPLDIVVFDMDWHRKDAAVGLGHAFTRGWTGYSWNRELIPDPGALLRELRAQDIYVTLNDHPHDGIRPRVLHRGQRQPQKPPQTALLRQLRAETLPRSALLQPGQHSEPRGPLHGGRSLAPAARRGRRTGLAARHDAPAHPSGHQTGQHHDCRQRRLHDYRLRRQHTPQVYAP